MSKIIKNTGIVRKLDELGRITLPIELRRNLDISEKDPVEIYVSEDMTSAVNEVGAWETSFNGIYLSDHYPVFVDVDMDKM